MIVRGMAYIQSARNPLVKQAAALRTGHGRRKLARVLVEGPKSAADALEAGARFEHAFAREGLEHPVLEALARARVAVHTLGAGLFEEISTTETSQGLVAVAREPEPDAAAVLAAPGRAPLAVLDRIQDPGNLGTILRTAAALGFRGAALTDGTADPYAPKVVRAAAGTLFRFPIFAWSDAAGADRFALVAAAEGGDPPETAFARVVAGGRPVALVVGNEGRGIDEALLARAAGRAWIPLERAVESLNVAAAFAILGYALARASKT
jgi:TrmH family RNA methyltransferase